MHPKVTGIDLSLAATGVAWMDGTVETLKPGDRRGLDRIHWTVARIVEGAARSDLAVLEGPAYSRATGAGHHEAAGLWWAVLDALVSRYKVPVAVVPPTTLKKYATGKGNATKPDMRMALYRRESRDLRDDNMVDARWLALMGLDHLGHPVVDVPKTHRDALVKVAWPEVTGDR